ncbi:MAG: bifunctional nuclease family protein [Anaerolineales bacterium]
MASDMVEMTVDSIRVSLMSQQRIIILREIGRERYLPIWIGVYEAESIAIALQEVEVARPLTHDLLKNVFTQLNAQIVRVEVISLHDDTYYGNIVIQSGARTLQMDARPSDALALAVRARVPILVAREVLDIAGIAPETDLQQEPAPADSGDQPPPIESDPISSERLSIFEDFLDSLGKKLDDPDQPEK